MQNRKAMFAVPIFTALALSLPMSYCFYPCALMQVFYGTWPIGHPSRYKILEGMTQEEILAMLGGPHERFEEIDGERWY
jgi:outer membrane protein assembly factor BamE (lipoprotein component of BamABCDE complex)